MRLHDSRRRICEGWGEVGVSNNKYLKNAIISSLYIAPTATNNPPQYAQRQRQFFDPETRSFTQKVARYSSDFVEAQVQGMNLDDPYKWETYRVRLANLVKPSAAIQRRFDDYKMVLFESKKIEYVRLGSKITTMGSTWLAYNPDNVSGASGESVFRRCNAVWNYLDFYGNVISEPIIVENDRANANDSDAQQSLLISKGYFNVICQYNDATRQIDTNTRFILGTAAYRVTGYSDFETEFTGDYGSLRLLYFTVRYEEPNKVIDDMANHVAGGLTFDWQILINSPSSLQAGMTAQLSAKSIRKGSGDGIIGIYGGKLIAPDDWYVNDKTVHVSDDDYVEGKTLYVSESVATYTWTSSDESILTVAADGTVTAIAEGEATITATLVQNPNYSASVTISVSATQDAVTFTSTVPQKLGAYETVKVFAAYFEDGSETAQPLTWEFTGADMGAYAALTAQDCKSATITCYGYSSAPLTVTVSYGNYTASESIQLEGF